MTRDEMIEEYKKIQNVNKDVEIIYHLMDELGLKYKRTRCNKCRNDYRLLIAEELGLIEDAAEKSDFNTTVEWRYLKKTATRWRGMRFNGETNPKLIEEFVKHFPTGFYERIENNNNNINNQERL